MPNAFYRIMSEFNFWAYLPILILCIVFLSRSKTALNKNLLLVFFSIQITVRVLNYAIFHPSFFIIRSNSLYLLADLFLVSLNLAGYCFLLAFIIKYAKTPPYILPAFPVNPVQPQKTP